VSFASVIALVALGFLLGFTLRDGANQLSTADDNFISRLLKPA